MTRPARAASGAPPWFVAGDLDGLFALFIDNVLMLMLIALLCPSVCGLPLELVFRRILPGAALSICAGNLFYGWQARRLARSTGRADVTALPYGINSLSVITFCYYIMGPVYAQTHDAALTWRMGLFACALTGVIEVAGAFCADWLRRNTPRAALLCPLAGLALTFLTGAFAFQIYAQPLIGLIPMLLVLIAYGGRIRLPWRLPAGFVAIGLGIVIATVCQHLGWATLPAVPVPDAVGFTPPVPIDMLQLLSTGGWRYLSVILPIAALGVLSSIQILESAEAAGDRYATRSSLLMNGVGTLCAAAFGSAFTTSLYVGHPAWKGLGARTAYSTINGVVIMLLCLFGGMSVVVRTVPMPVAFGIILWIGLIMMAQAFGSVPRRQAPAVALGLVPALGAWVLIEVQTTLGAVGSSLSAVAGRLEPTLHLSGIVALSQGSLFSSMLLGACLTLIIERRFLRAAGWAAAASLLAFVGVIHAGRIEAGGIVNRFGWAAAPGFAAAYLTGAGVLALCHLAQRRHRAGPPAARAGAARVRPAAADADAEWETAD